MRILLCAAVVMGCGPAATPAPEEAVENEQPREIIDEQPPVAVVVIVDRSGSMQGDKLDLARVGAHAVAEALPDNALFAMLAFDSEAATLVPMQAVRHHDEIAKGIDTLTAGGGTNYFPALRAASELLEAVNAGRKVVVFLSDGEAPYDGVVDLVTDMAQHGVRTSTVGLEGADRNLLSEMAEAGGGSLFMLGDLESLPKVMQKAVEP